MTGASVLIVEDDSTLARGLRDYFETHGFRVRVARDGQAGWEAVLASPPDLVLLDIMLPNRNGYEICHDIRARNLDMPIIMLTAKDQEEDIVRGLELGADDYVTKPFSIKELLARARAFLRRRQTDTVYDFGEYRLDLAAHQLSKNGAVVALTAKEFRLLEHFLKHAGRALTRDQILDAVWGDDITVNDRSVDRCVTTLRAKIEPHAHRPIFIQTIRDIGYRFAHLSAE
jgi:DNA-binding response OmpR family regulator